MSILDIRFSFRRMRKTDRHRRSAWRASILAAVLLASACASPSRLTNNFLDQRTGVTVTSSVTPLLLYRENSSYAAYARNYVQLGPIEVNQSGNYRYFLWVSIWGTMQDAESGKQRNGFDSITIIADSEPLSLDLAGWTPSAIGASQPVYLQAVASAAGAYYFVTSDQIRLIATARDLRLRTTDPSPREYRLWDSQQHAQQSFQAFLQAASF